MPIYAYRCESCGHAKDVLQKISDPLLTVCPACGAAEFKKQVTSAGFQLKGSGWYVTDFRGGKTETSKESAAESGGDKATADKQTSDKPNTDKPKGDAAAPANPAAVSAPASASSPAAAAAPAAASAPAAPASK